ncbi:MAG: MoxR family ATPase [Ruminococcaceae bacterium]|nr:MoxR family ATPase [Oscillospiraceae bacterium]
MSDIRELQSRVDAIIEQTEKVVVGKRAELVLLLSAMIAGGHVLIEDVPGVGKTTMVSAISRAAGLDFHRAQFTPDVMASDITGFNMYNRATDKFEFRDGLAMCNLLLADEINRASPKTQSALLEAMEEGSVTVDGKTYTLPSPFIVIATQNPSGYVGTYPLPEAQLDRFSLRLSMGYPTEAEELSILTGRREGNPISSVTAVADAAMMKKIIDAAAGIRMDVAVCKYIVSLIHATRKNPSISLGASPRASVALMRLARAYAFVNGRDYVLPEDVSALFLPAISHRIILSQEARINRESKTDILRDILASVEVPYVTGR